ncbi:helix-turn-helix domain-containing protein [Epilithonimonas sp.]|uniref:helix-turn-helix domain-containing protein n=1 Tax=Epilithonimonas sp. TaxID=2894511 RepID=UPI00289B2734|nr:helix-turn-helix domain-containing protein [Epilithonimonas sp.]
MSLAYLATYCETNSKYLSHIIKLYRNNDFNNYINTLRIRYITSKLRNEPIYRKYKIAILAEEAGFSSPNKFSTNFKKVTSITPSLFIKSLQKPVS